MGWFSKSDPEKDAKNPPATPETMKASASAARDVPENDLSPAPQKPGPGLLSRLKQGLSKTRDILTTDIEDLFKGRRKSDQELLEEIEEILITSDMGVGTTRKLLEHLGKNRSALSDKSTFTEALKAEMIRLMPSSEPDVWGSVPRVFMVVGVNGVGKTTTIGKLAARFKSEGRRVLIVAADTFRAAAVEQLSVWADRSGADLVKHRENADPAAVAYDGVEAAIARGKDAVIIDTAGRLHTRVNLMEELKKIKRAVQKRLPDAPHETLLVLDATTGQNALSQAKLFHESIDITGLILTKLDGTARGGVVVNVSHSLGLPLKFIGVGERMEDLQTFDPEVFVDALFD